MFSVASRLHDVPAFNVYTVAEMAGPVRTRDGLRVCPRHTIENCPTPDILLVPGGQGTRVEMDKERVIEWIRQRSEDAELVLSVCTGALLLGKAGLLGGLRATTHLDVLDLLRETAPDAEVLEDVRFVDNGRVVLSAGVSAGIDMALHIVARLLGEEAALATARHLEYAWRPGPGNPFGDSGEDAYIAGGPSYGR